MIHNFPTKDNFEILTYFARVLFSSTTRKNAREIIEFHKYC